MDDSADLTPARFFGIQVAVLREACNLTQAQLADLLGTGNQSFVSRVERGDEENLTTKTMQRFAEVFGGTLRPIIDIP